MATLADLMIKIRVDPSQVRKGAGRAVESIDKQFRKLDKIAGTAIKTMTGLSGIAPLAMGAVGGVAALGGAFAAAGAAVGVFGAVVGSTISDVSENATKVEDLTEKIRLYGRSAKLAGKYGLEGSKYIEKQKKAMLELEARLSLLPPAERRATMSFIEMKNSWADFVDNNKPTTFAFLQKGYDLIGKTVGKLQPLYNIGAQAAGRLLDRMNNLVDGGFIERLVARAGPAMNSLVTIIMNLGTTFGHVFGKMADKQGQSMLSWIEDLTGRWAAWASNPKENEGLNKLISYMTENGPKVVAILGDLVDAAQNIVKALSPFAPISLAIAGALTQIIAAIPPDVLTALVTGYLAWATALKLWAAWQAIATAVQWAQNSAMLAWPGTWIIAGILLLIAAIVLIATKTDWFQRLWKATWSFFKMIGAWFGGPFANFFVKGWQMVWNFFKMIGAWFAGPFADFFVRLWNKIKGGFSSFYNWIVGRWNALVGFLKNVRSKIAGAIDGMWDGLKNGFRRVINWVISKWNGISFKIPSVTVFGQTFGGGTIGVPPIPQMAKGGIVKPRRGGTLVNVGEARQREAIIPLDRGMPDIAQGRTDRPVVIQIVPGGESEFRRWINKSIRVQGALRAG